MVTVKRASLLAAAAAFSAWAVSASANPADLRGTWMHVGDRYGLLAGYVEQVDVSGDGGVSVQLYRNRSADLGCDGDASSSSCANPQPTARGALKVDADTRQLSLARHEETAPGFSHPAGEQAWQALRFASSVPWTYELEGDVLRLSRKAPGAGAAGVIEKTYHRVDAQMPADLYDFLIVMQLPIHRAGCAVDAIQAEPAMRQAFRELVGAVAPAAHGGDTAAAAELFHWLMANPEGNDALFPGAVPALPQIAACIEEMK